MKLHNLGCADLFRCVFCRDLVKKPKMMSCMHTACFDCLEKNFNDSKVICKACEAVNSVKSVDKFVDQNYVRNIMDIVESSQKSEVCLAKCLDCDVDICENNMLFTCLTCSESSPNDDHDSAHSNFVPLLTNEKPTARYLMCINCFDHHCLQNPSHKVFACCATMDPSLLSDSDSRRALCPKHKHPVLSFCVKQGKAMCTSCLKSHKSADDHEHLTGIQLKALVKSKVDCGKRFHDNIRNFNSRIKEFKRDLEREKRTHIDNTQQLFAKLHEILRENEKQILSKISTAYDSKFADLEETETRGQYYEHLGDRLAQTASDLLCLSSEEENFAFASSLDLLVTQLPAFCGDIEEDLRRKLKGKPVLSLDKKTFEDFKKAQYVSVEEQEVKFADSICCTITDSEQSRMTLITLTSDLMHSKYAHNNNNAIDTGDFKVELTLTGKAPITIPVEKTEDVSVEESGEETNSTKFVACIDPDVVAAGVYRLSISYRGEKVKSPEVVNIFSKYDSGSFGLQNNYKRFRLPSEIKKKFKSSSPDGSQELSGSLVSGGMDDDIELLPDDIYPVGGSSTFNRDDDAGGGDRFLNSVFKESDFLSHETDLDDIFQELNELGIPNTPSDITADFDCAVPDAATELPQSATKTRRVKRRNTTKFSTDRSENHNELDPGSISDDAYVNYYCDRFKFPTVPGSMVYINKLFTLGSRGKNKSAEGLFQYPIGCSVSAAGDILICDHGNNRVQVFDVNGKLKSVVGSKLLIRPSAVVCAENGAMAVRADNGIFYFDKHGQSLQDRNIKSKSAKFCYGLAAVGTSDLMFVNTSRQGTGSLVRINWEGKVISEQVYEPLSSGRRPPKSKCRFMDIYNDNVFVSDLGASKIYVTSLDGKCLLTFGSHGSKFEDLNEPAGIKCTEGFILVSDSKNNRLKVYGMNGMTVSELQFPHGDIIKRPSDICLGSNGILVVNSFLTHEVYVYQLQASH